VVLSSVRDQAVSQANQPSEANNSSMAAVAAPGAFDAHSLATSDKSTKFDATAANGHLAAGNAPAGSRSYTAAALVGGKGTSSGSSSTYPSIAARQALFYEGVEQVSCPAMQIRRHGIERLHCSSANF
jgi:hypothetical protein